MGNAYGGLAVAQTIGPDGTYTLDWQVSPDAPLGDAAEAAGVASPVRGLPDLEGVGAIRCGGPVLNALGRWRGADWELSPPGELPIGLDSWAGGGAQHPAPPGVPHAVI
jgi:hypothetical protein